MDNSINGFEHSVDIISDMQEKLDFLGSESQILAGLNKEQRRAVEHTTGPLLIIAGAGTGKTTVVTKKIAYLIDQKTAKPSEILALTFTEKAAAEMEERVDQLVPYGFTDMWISTFHAFGDRILRDFSLDLGLPANFKVLTSTEQAIFLRQNIYAFDLKYFRPIANPISHIEALLSHFSRLKDELIEPEDYIAFAEQQVSILKADKISTEADIIEAEKNLELSHAYLRYNELMLQAGNLDFGDQLFLTYKLLKTNKKVLETCQEKFKFIIVDEYQDTNLAQNEIVKLIADKYKNITVVGDDDQSIYRFRGASISNILSFSSVYKNMTQIVLNQNYRSTQEILDSSYKLIQNNNPNRLEIKNNINKRLISSKHGALPELLHCETLSCEADTVARKIKSLRNDHTFSYKDFAILIRANSQAEPFIQSLNMEGIPYAFSGASGLFSQPEIKMIVSFLKCLAYPDDNLSFYQLATSELYQISHERVTDYYAVARHSNRSMIESIENDTITETAENEESEKIKNLISDIQDYQKMKNDQVGEVLYDYLSNKGYLKKLVANPTAINEKKINNIAKFFNRISEFTHTSDQKDVLSFLHNLELILEVGDEAVSSDIDPDLDAVNILTAHASKGLEWPVVFIANCVADRFPSRKKRDPLPIPAALVRENLSDDDFHIEEERRLFYVAATRAKQYLFLTSADDYGGKRVKKLSPFVMELLDEVNPGKLKYKLSAEEKIERFKKLPDQPIRIPKKFSEKVLRLSRQQIDDYFSCPKKFYFAHVIKIPLLENHYLMYGTAIHAALDHYFSRKINGETPTLSSLIADYEAAFKNVGFITREQEDLRKTAGIETLTRFYDENQDNKLMPSYVEAAFEFNENDIKINGRYDLVFGSENNSEIVDFKTSDVKDQKDADKRIKASTQMQIYALAWFEKYGKIPKTTLHFIESGLRGEITFKQDDLNKTKQMIFEVADGIRKGEMAAKPEQRQCRLCPYKDICPEAVN